MSWGLEEREVEKQDIERRIIPSVISKRVGNTDGDWSGNLNCVPVRSFGWSCHHGVSASRDATGIDNIFGDS